MGRLSLEMKRESICLQKSNNNKQGKDSRSQYLLICMARDGAVIDNDGNVLVVGGAICGFLLLLIHIGFDCKTAY